MGKGVSDIGCLKLRSLTVISVMRGFSSKQAKFVMAIGQAIMSSLKLAQQSQPSSACGPMSRAYFCTTTLQYTKKGHPMPFQHQRCPETHSNGSPVLAQGCAMGDSPMAHLSHYITLTITPASLASSKEWSKSYVNEASSQPIGS
jgi:hypothetical protein